VVSSRFSLWFFPSFLRLPSSASHFLVGPRGPRQFTGCGLCFLISCLGCFHFCRTLTCAYPFFSFLTPSVADSPQGRFFLSGVSSASLLPSRPYRNFPLFSSASCAAMAVRTPKSLALGGIFSSISAFFLERCFPLTLLNLSRLSKRKL